MSTTTASLDRPSLSNFRLLIMAPPVAALCYPFLLKGFNASVTAATGGSALFAALLLLLALAVPAVGICVAQKLGTIKDPTSTEIQAKRIALLSVAAPPLFVASGVVLYMAGDPIADTTFWMFFWGSAIALAARCAASSRGEAMAFQGEVSPRLRVAHGAVTVAILFLFLAMHISNHLAGLWSEAMHRHVMDLFRVIYRAGAVEPLVVLLFLFQVGSGIALLWGHTRRSADFFRTFQLASGAFLIFFILGHMNSVFFYARTFANIKTDWDFATGAPTGLIKDAWNIRLLPHYLVGVFFVLSHIVLGARVVALGHNVQRATADRLAKIGIAISAIVATAIIVGMAGIHIG